MADSIPKDLQVQVDQAAELQRSFETKAKELKDAETQIKATWKQVESVMIEHDIKSIKGDWGSITIAERTNYKAEDLDAVPSKFLKKALDTNKIAAAFKLENKLPKGITTSVTQYLTKRIK